MQKSCLGKLCVELIPCWVVFPCVYSNIEHFNTGNYQIGSPGKAQALQLLPTNHFSTCLEISTHIKVNEVASGLGVEQMFTVSGLGKTCLKSSSFTLNEWKIVSSMRIIFLLTKYKTLPVLKN